MWYNNTNYENLYCTILCNGQVQKTEVITLTKQEICIKACDVLEQVYPESVCALHYAHPYQLVIAVRLSAQCTDARVNIVTKELFAKYPTLESFAEADLAELEAVIKPCGFYHMKAKSIKEMANQLLTQFGGRAAAYHGGTAHAVRCRQKICQFDFGRYFRTAGNCGRYALYSHYRTAWSDQTQGTGKGGAGFTEIGSAGTLFGLLSPGGAIWAGCLPCEKTTLFQLSYGRLLQVR